MVRNGMSQEQLEGLSCRDGIAQAFIATRGHWVITQCHDSKAVEGQRFMLCALQQMRFGEVLRHHLGSWANG